MTTAIEIITQSLRKIHAIGRGETLPADEAQDALTALNDMISSWSVEGGYVFAETSETFNLTGSNNYTIGTGGDFDTDRPYEIVTAYTTLGSIDTPVDLIDQTEYANIADKSARGTANQLYYDNNFPLGNIKLYPVPDAGHTLTLNTYKVLSRFDSLTSTVDLPPGYNAALVFNLAIDLAPEYEKEPMMTVIKQAAKYKSVVFTSNTRNDKNISSVDAVLLDSYSDYNVYRGY